jgi:hypothetical protein
MAPEIFEMQEYDAKADLWSVGCIYYEMLVGCPPFKGLNPKELFQNIKTKPLTIPPDIAVSMESLSILKKLLERNPIRRTTLEQFVESVRNLPLLNKNNSQSGLSKMFNSDNNVNSNSNNNNNDKNISINNDSISNNRDNNNSLTIDNDNQRYKNNDLSLNEQTKLGNSNTSNGQQQQQQQQQRKTDRINPATATTMMSLGGQQYHPTTNITPQRRNSSDYTSNGGNNAGTSPTMLGTSPLATASIGMGIGKAASVVDYHQVEGRQRAFSDDNVDTNQNNNNNLRSPQSSSPPLPNLKSSSPELYNNNNYNNNNNDDDFVIIETNQSNSLKQSLYDEQQQQLYTKQHQQQSIDNDTLVLVNHLQRCEYICSILAAMTNIADNMAKDVVTNELQTLQRANSISLNTRPRGDSGDTMYGTILGACSIYLHSLHFLHDIMERTYVICQSFLNNNNSSYKQQLLSCQKVREDLVILFDQLVNRAEQCQSR